MDKNDFMHFVNSLRGHCTILMNNTRLNEDIDETQRGVCDIRPEWRQNAWQLRKFNVTVDWQD